MNKIIKNTGLNWTREVQEMSAEDYVFGARKSSCIADGMNDVRPYLPNGEKQNIGEEKMDCSPRSVANYIESIMNFALQNDLLSKDNVDWFTQIGYIINNEFEVSDAHIAIRSGVTRQGTSLKAPCLAVHDYAVIPKVLMPQLDTFKEHINPARITPDIEKIEKEFLERIDINFYRVYPNDYNKTGIHTGGYAWGNIEDGVYQRVEYQANHAFFHFPINECLDNYIDIVDGDFIKKLAPDYKLLPHSYRITLNERSKNVSIKKDYSRAWKILKAFFGLNICQN